MRFRNLKSPKALVVQLAVTAILAAMVGWFAGATSLPHSRSFNRAFMNYIHDRTPENEAALHVERGKLRRIRDIAALTAAVLFFVLCNFVWWLRAKYGRTSEGESTARVVSPIAVEKSRHHYQSGHGNVAKYSGNSARRIASPEGLPLKGFGELRDPYPGLIAPGL